MKKDIIRIKELVADNQYKEAIEYATSCYSKNKCNCFLNEIAQIYLSQKKQKDAIVTYLKMLKNEKNNEQLLNKIALCYFQMGNFKKSLKYYKKVHELNPFDARNNFNLGCAYHYLNKNNDAIDYYNNAIKINPQYISALNNLGIIYYENNYHDVAIKLHKTALYTNKQHPEAYHHLGIIYREYKNDLELSELYLKKSIMLDPKHAENHYQLALTLIKAEKTKEAINSLTNCLEINSKHKNSYELLKKLKLS